MGRTAHVDVRWGVDDHRMDDPGVLHRIIEQSKRYMVPRPDGRVLIGSTEEEAGFDKRTTALGIGELLAFGLSLVPALAGNPMWR